MISKKWYSTEFKIAAVQLSDRDEAKIQIVAAALRVHPTLLSRWRRELRDGKLRRRSKLAVLPTSAVVSERPAEPLSGYWLRDDERECLKNAAIEIENAEHERAVTNDESEDLTSNGSPHSEQIEHLERAVE